MEDGHELMLSEMCERHAQARDFVGFLCVLFERGALAKEKDELGAMVPIFWGEEQLDPVGVGQLEKFRNHDAKLGVLGFWFLVVSLVGSDGNGDDDNDDI